MSYDVIVADPPWMYSGSPTKWGAAGKEYPLMEDEEIFSLDVADRLSDRGVLFLWATGPKLHTAMHAIERWGLHYRGIAFVWVKTKQDGTPIGAQGVKPSIVKPTTELVLAASKVRSGRSMPLASESIVQTVLAPRTRHSEKPDAVQERIEIMYPAAKRLELFARRERPGWDCWGNEL